jgi:RNA polymerase-binding transcription factor DksA
MTDPAGEATSPEPGVDPSGARRRVRTARDAVAAQVEGLAAVHAGIVESSELVATDDEHDPEGHTIAFEREQVAALLRDARIRLDDLRAALARIADGTYGACAECHGPIALERLEAAPEATRCIACAR